MHWGVEGYNHETDVFQVVHGDAWMELVSPPMEGKGLKTTTETQ